MAEFKEVMQQYNRMFEACKQGVSVPVEASYANAVKRPDFFEEVVMSWAAEHPEPVYPTWGEYLCDIGLIDVCMSEKEAIDRIFFNTISPDTAGKLGVKPKEE